jgi:hypothetical protein
MDVNQMRIGVTLFDGERQTPLIWAHIPMTVFTAMDEMGQMNALAKLTCDLRDWVKKQIEQVPKKGPEEAYP